MDSNIVVGQLCKSHNLPIVYMTQNGPVCVVCLGQKEGMISLEDYNNYIQNIIQQAELETDNFKQFLVDHLNAIVKKKEQLLKQIDVLIQLILDEQNSIDERKKNFKTQIKLLINNSQGLDVIYKKLENQQVEFQSIKDTLKKQMEQLKNIDRQLIQLINPIKKVPKSKILDEIPPNDRFQEMAQKSYARAIQQQQSLKQIEQNQKQQVEKHQKITYEEIFKLDCKRKCNCFDFNLQNSILLMGQKQDIVIYELSFGQLKNQIQIIKEHRRDVEYLLFIRKSDNFISACYYQILLWNKLQGKNQWVLKQIILKGFFGSNLILNKNQNLLFSGTQHFTFKDPTLLELIGFKNSSIIGQQYKLSICNFTDDEWKIQQTIEPSQYLYTLSLNETEDTLIASGENSNILVYTYNNKKWLLELKIITEKGYRLIFTTGSQFVFQPIFSEYFYVYDFYDIREVEQIKIQTCFDKTLLFPCQFIKSLGILIVKHGQYLNIFQYNQFGSFQLIQTIQFKDEQYYGRISDDGRFLVTWDKGDQQIKIRQFQNHTKVFQ